LSNEDVIQRESYSNKNFHMLYFILHTYCNHAMYFTNCVIYQSTLEKKTMNTRIHEEDD